MSKADDAGERGAIALRALRRVLGESISDLIEGIARFAHDEGLPLYLAGGVVRDLQLKQRTTDLDFVAEGDAIAFANSLARRYGGSVQAHKPFGTAKWLLDDAAAERLALTCDESPGHIDFVTARRETYAQPTALPKTAPSSIQRDMQRRDFSINALAIQLSPLSQFGRLLDDCGGGADLDQKLIRALHPQSFVDDPTRILRAIRYARRLGFDLETETAELLRAALPYLGRVTGQRLRNEIDLILREKQAAAIMLHLQELGALTIIHPAFRLASSLPALIESCNRLIPPWVRGAPDNQTLRWNMIMLGVGGARVGALCERLALTKALTQSIVSSARLAERLRLLESPVTRPSAVTRTLDDYPDSALQVAWHLAAETPGVKTLIATYASDWRQRRPTISGKDLKNMGIPPGPRYRSLLDQLRFAWIDGEVRSVEDERALLRQLLAAAD